LQRGLLRPLGLLPHPLGVFSCLAAPVIHQTGFIVPPLTADETLPWWGTPRSIYGLFELLRISDCGLRIEYVDDRALDHDVGYNTESICCWGRSSVGRAPHSHCGGRRFESGRLHQKTKVPCLDNRIRTGDLRGERGSVSSPRW